MLDTMSPFRLGRLLLLSVLWAVMACTGGEKIAPPPDGCSSCPDKCLRTGEGKGICVNCLTDEQCQTPASPTKKCTKKNVCVCGSEKDCPKGEQCASGTCVECITDAHCKTASDPFCVANKCQSCRQGDTRPCSVDSPDQCDVGAQTCQASGIWGACKFSSAEPKKCAPDEICEAGACICQIGLKRCEGKCVDVSSEAKHCGKCGNACASGGRCASGRCVNTCPVSTPTECADACVNISLNRFFCGNCSNACKIGQICLDGKCQCPAGQLLCGAQCIDPLTNPKHCGQCDKTCAAGSLCAIGACKTSCPKSTPETCFGSCVDFQTNSEHCGKCGQACRLDQRCVEGACKCPLDFLNCGDLCVDPKTHPEHCGGCGKVCKEGQKCASGVCLLTCPKSTPSICYGGCVDLKNNNQHCGKCGNTCPDGQACSDGKCVCPPTTELCQGQCINVKENRLHCGKCGTPCADNQSCAAGKCVFSCPSTATALCFGACVDLKTNHNNCGVCAKQCDDNQECVSGECRCPQTLQLCNRRCVDLQNDVGNCGNCSTVCTDVESCVQGLCIYRGCGGGETECKKSCVDTKTDAFNCGKCDEKCQAGEFCRDGKCADNCKATEKLCAGVCIDLQTSAVHCGACNQSCKSTETCTGGICISAGCTAEKPLKCSGACVDTLSDKNNCGACGTVCSKGEECCVGKCTDISSEVLHCGQCGSACRGTESCCGGGCVDTTNDAKNCGKCSTSCKEGDNCCGGQCGQPVQGVLDGCNVKDDDCDGSIDEDCYWAATASGTLLEKNVSSVSGVTKRILSMAVNSKGEVYIIGQFSKSMTFAKQTLTTTNASELFVAKLSSGGTFIWSMTADGTKGSAVHSLLVTAKDDVYISGNFSTGLKYGTTTLTSLSQSELFVAQIDPLKGKFLWVAPGKGTATSLSAITAITEGITGRLFVAGNFTESIELGKTKLTSKGKSDFFIGQFDLATRAYVSLLSGGGTDSEGIRTMKKDVTGKLIVMGHYGQAVFQFGGKAFTKINVRHVFVMNYNPIAQKADWVAGIPSTQTITGAALGVSPAGDIYIGGAYTGTTTLGASSFTAKNGSVDFFCSQISKLGSVAWTLSIPTDGPDEGTSIAVEPSTGNVLFSGFYGGTGQFGLFFVQNKGLDDFVAAKIDTKGKLIWAEVAGTAQREKGLAVAVGPQGNIFMAGSFTTDITVNGFTLKFGGTNDLFIIKRKP